MLLCELPHAPPGPHAFGFPGYLILGSQAVALHVPGRPRCAIILRTCVYGGPGVTRPPAEAHDVVQR